VRDVDRVGAQRASSVLASVLMVQQSSSRQRHSRAVGNLPAGVANFSPINECHQRVTVDGDELEAPFARAFARACFIWREFGWTPVSARS
jgi:hypothetical protein